MRPRILAPLFLLALATVAAAACGGGGGGPSGTAGSLTDPERVPTASPWKQPPEVIILDPNNLTPISGGGPLPEESGAAGEATPEPGTCGKTYTIQPGDSFSLIAEKCGLRPRTSSTRTPGSTRGP